jgi:hypothetical protein
MTSAIALKSFPYFLIPVNKQKYKFRILSHQKLSALTTLNSEEQLVISPPGVDAAGTVRRSEVTDAVASVSLESTYVLFVVLHEAFQRDNLAVHGFQHVLSLSGWTSGHADQVIMVDVHAPRRLPLVTQEVRVWNWSAFAPYGTSRWPQAASAPDGKLIELVKGFE